MPYNLYFDYHLRCQQLFHYRSLTMKILSFLLLLFWISSISISYVSAKEQTHMPLDERVQKLTQMSFRKPLIRFNSDKFRTFIGSKSAGQPIRNYTIVVMLTALSPGRQCSVCRSAADEFSIVANSWRYSSQFTSELFFALVDYDEGSEIFQQLKINSAPVFLLFKDRNVRINTLSLKHAEQMDIQRIGFAAETIARWIHERTKIQIRIVRPQNYTATFLLIIMLVFFSLILYVRRNNFDFLSNTTSWAIISLAIIFAMTSGQMWSHIRGPPLLHRSQHGISYIHNSSGGQFIIETYFIFLIYSIITIGFIFMIQSVKQQSSSTGGNNMANGKNSDPKRKKVMLIISIVLIAIFFSFLMSIFRSKAHGYPYSFLFK
ncbi:hypothetical protein NH340_JMT08225 [Sarcoptes scabiei]|nr:hypothetical protein NH340_JMT08225 [Sarcoptes scabiei]